MLSPSLSIAIGDIPVPKLMSSVLAILFTLSVLICLLVAAAGDWIGPS
jgi:hypothetical protein